MNFFTELGKSFLPSSDAFIFMWVLATVGFSSLSIVVERWLNLKRRTDYDAPGLFTRIKALIESKKLDDAYAVCASGGSRALPRILAAGIKKAQIAPALVSSAMQEETIHMSSKFEKRMNHIVMFSNTSTLFGLLGTVFGLIMSFTAVSRPGVSAVEKSSLLAGGISTAMNSTLVGLTISVMSVIAYAFIKARLEQVLSELDRYAVAILNLLMPPTGSAASAHTSFRRRGNEDEAADADVTPMLNLMVILIPVLLTSSEFVKVGNIEIKLPEAVGGGGAGNGAAEAPPPEEVKLDLGVIITSKGFNLLHHFQGTGEFPSQGEVDIPIVKGQYDFDALNQALAKVRRRILYEVVKAYVPGTAPDASLQDLSAAYNSHNLAGANIYPDRDNVKIVGEEKITYQTVISVMDAARSVRVGAGALNMFPNVSIAGGIVQ